MTTLARQHDCLLLDLDGTVFRGHEATPGAVESLAGLDARLLYVTNNASRAPQQVAEHLRELGFSGDADDVVTSAQSAARVLAAQLPADARVLVVGTEALADEVRNVGLRPVRQFAEDPVAVVQGHNPQTGWAVSAGLPSLMVLSGVSTATDAVFAAEHERPDYIAADLRSLHVAAETLRVGPQPEWRVEVDSDRVEVYSTGKVTDDPLSVVRAVAHAVWTDSDDHVYDNDGYTLVAGDDTARAALQRASLLSPSID